jgi:hypothetical protein
MECATIKEGTYCTFMAKSGCTFSGGRCISVAEKCEGCANTKEFPAGVFCTVFANPGSKWMLGRCNFATHIKAEGKKEEKMLNPLKASKRAAGKK